MTQPVESSEPSLGSRPNPRYQHGFAIIRIDEYSDPGMPIEGRITVKKIVRTAEEAEHEVERLNQLRAGKRGRYFSQITRLEPTDQAEGGAEPAFANRISAFIPEPAGDAITAEKRAKLEAVIVPDFVQESLPEGWGFPAFRTCEICATPTKTAYIKWHKFHFCIYSKNNDGFVEIAGTYERQPDRREVVFCALRVFPDLTEESIYDMMPLAILKLMVDTFGLTLISGSNHGKFFLTEEFPIPTIVVPGTQKGYVSVASVPEGHAHRDVLFHSPAGSVVRIPLGFSIDTTEYQRWVESH